MMLKDSLLWKPELSAADQFELDQAAARLQLAPLPGVYSVTYEFDATRSRWVRATRSRWVRANTSMGHAGILMRNVARALSYQGRLRGFERLLGAVAGLAAHVQPSPYLRRMDAGAACRALASLGAAVAWMGEDGTVMRALVLELR